MTERDYAPLPLEYLDTLDVLSDEDFGKLCRALLLYAASGEPIALDGDARFFCKMIMAKDDYYSRRFAEEQQKATARRNHARTAAHGRYHKNSEPSDPASDSSSMPEQTISDHNNSSQITSPHLTSDQVKSNTSLSDEREVCAELQAEPCPPAPAAILPLLGKESFGVTEEEIRQWSAAYPAVDVKQELLKMAAWLDANPKQKKTCRGIRRFINNWLSREQDRGGRKNAPVRPPQDAHVLIFEE